MELFSIFSILLHYVNGYVIETVLFIIVLHLAQEVIKSHLKNWKKLPPGPWGFPIFGYLPFLSAEPHKSLASLKEKYGDIIGIKLGLKYVVVLNEYSIIKEALSNPATFNRPPGFFGPIRLGFGVASGQDWNEQRRYVLHVMRNLGLGKGIWEDLAQESAGRFTETLKKYKGKPVNITKELQGILASTIMSLLYGKKLQPETEKDKIEKCAEFSYLGLKYYGPSMPASLLPGFHRFCEIFNIANYRKSADSMKNFLNMTKKEIDKHWSDESYQHYEDYMNMYKSKLTEMGEFKGNHFFNDVNMEGNANSLFLGSSDTSTSSLRTLFRLMANHPDVQKRIQDELDEVIGREGTISYNDRFNIPQTFAALLEAQRYVSTVPLANARQLSEDMELRGYHLPKGSWLISNIYAIHNDPNYWENPREYKPERFLVDNTVQKNIKSFAPFSMGKRNCPGETVAWVVIIALFTKVMQNYTICLPPGDTVILETEGGVVSHLKPQPLCFVERP